MKSTFTLITALLLAPPAALLATTTPKLTKPNIGFGGESGGPEGEKASVLEFRRLRITATP